MGQVLSSISSGWRRWVFFRRDFRLMAMGGVRTVGAFGFAVLGSGGMNGVAWVLEEVARGG